MGIINIPISQTGKLSLEALSNPLRGPQLELAELEQNQTPLDSTNSSHFSLQTH